MKARWEEFEQRIADDLGGYRTKASGACWYDKGDGKTAMSDKDPIVWECKSTSRSSFRVSSEIWGSLMRAAAGREPILFVLLGDGSAFAVMLPSFAYRLGFETCIDDVASLGTVIFSGMEMPSAVKVKTTSGRMQPLLCVGYGDFLDAYRGWRASWGC